MTVEDGASARTYRVVHRTTYAYASPVASGQTLAHLLPRATPNQHVRVAELTVRPDADHLVEHRDAFGNRTTYLAIERPHDHVELVATSEVDVAPYRWPDASPPWDEVVRALDRDTGPEGVLARACRTASALVDRADGLAALTAPTFTPGRPLHEAVADLTARIHARFRFDPSATDVATPVAEVLAAGGGVCQDFAHLAIACCRAVGLAARYVSGYLETEPPPGRPKLVGADASHAWFAVHLPGWGWFDADPTNDQAPPHRHVTVAWGRDYADVAPARGVVFGPATTQELQVSVDVSAA